MTFEQPSVVLEFTTDYEYLGLQYYAGETIELYDDEAALLIARGVARKKEPYCDSDNAT